jgi:hypothetical protein
MAQPHFFRGQRLKKKYKYTEVLPWRRRGKVAIASAS